jgi:hypothetical protein
VAEPTACFSTAALFDNPPSATELAPEDTILVLLTSAGGFPWNGMLAKGRNLCQWQMSPKIAQTRKGIAASLRIPMRIEGYRIDGFP